MKKIIGTVPFLNSHPLTYSIDNNSYKDYKTIKMLPSTLLKSLVNKESFISLLSIADHFSNNKVMSLEDYCISSNGKVDSVILISTSKLKDIKKVILDSRSRSANMLCKVLNQELIPRDIAYDFAYPTSDTKYISEVGYVIIGDLGLEIVSSRPNGLNIYDLGELWFKETSLPFTFATFNYYGEVPSSEEINILHESYSEGSKNLSSIVDDFLINSKFKIKKKIAEAYLQERIIYKITEKHLEGINLFNKLSSKFANWEKNSFNNTDK